MFPEVSVSSLTGLTLAPEFNLRRMPPSRVKILQEEFWHGYDSETLFYAAVYCADRQSLHLFAPRLLNFKPLLKTLRFEFGGQVLTKPRLRSSKKFDRLDFHDVTKFASSLLITHEGRELSLPVRLADPLPFIGRNVIYTLSKNNDLEWIRDWLIWHHRQHGADAVILADNGSTLYDSRALSEVIRAVPGYRSAEIVEVPFKYGPAHPTAKYAGDGEFLQLAMMNMFWLQSMRHARAMVNVDVDELVVSRSGRRLFDAVTTARFGMISFEGQWHMAAPTEAGIRHSDHYLTDPDDKPCAPKYALDCQRGIARFRELKVHSVSGFRQMPFVNRDEFWFMHCRNISSSWKYDRSAARLGRMNCDDKTKALLESVLGTAR